MTQNRSGSEDFSHTTLPNLKQHRLDEDGLRVCGMPLSENDVEQEEGPFKKCAIW